MTHDQSRVTRVLEKTVCPSGAVLTWIVATRPDPFSMDRMGFEVVTTTSIPLGAGGEAVIGTCYYTSVQRAGRSAWLSVILPDGRHNGRYVRGDVARRVAERVASYVDSRWGVNSDSDQW